MLPERSPAKSRIEQGPDASVLAVYTERFRFSAKYLNGGTVLESLNTEEKRDAARDRQIAGFTEIRRKILDTVPYYQEDQLVEHFGLGPEDISELVDAGILFCFTDHDDRLFPSFQFDPETDEPYPVVQSVNALIKTSLSSSWSVLDWWRNANEGLQSAPMDMVADRSLHASLLEGVSRFVAEDSSY